jgi:hypothetical protein
VAINAIGDVAMIIALNAYECALTICDHRHRIERVEAVHSRLPECFAHLGVVATIGTRIGALGTCLGRIAARWRCAGERSVIEGSFRPWITGASDDNAGLDRTPSA